MAPGASGLRIFPLVLSSIVLTLIARSGLPPATCLPLIIISCRSLILLLSQTISFNCPFPPPAVSLPCRRKKKKKNSLLWLGACPSPWIRCPGWQGRPLGESPATSQPSASPSPGLYWGKVTVCLRAEPLLACSLPSSTLLSSNSCAHILFLSLHTLSLVPTLLPALGGGLVWVPLEGSSALWLPGQVRT